MSTLVLHRKEEQLQQQPIKQSNLRVRLIGPAIARARTFARRLRASGFAIEVFRSSEDGALDIDPNSVDAFIYLASSAKELPDIKRLHACRQQKSLVPLIVVAPAAMSADCLDAGAD